MTTAYHATHPAYVKSILKKGLVAPFMVYDPDELDGWVYRPYVILAVDLTDIDLEIAVIPREDSVELVTLSGTIPPERLTVLGEVDGPYEGSPSPPRIPLT